MIRPELRAASFRYREVIWAAGLALVGLWVMGLGGYVLVPIGVGVVAIAVALAILALRRLRFAQTGDAPGVVDVLEGQITYFGPSVGGSVGLPDLVEIRLITMRGRRLWRLRQADGQALLIPVEATGADRLFDVFASLPGINMTTVLGALGTANAVGNGGPSGTDLTVGAQTVTVWLRPKAGAVSRT